MRSPVPDGVRTELDRVVQRWHQLPLDHALSSLPSVTALVHDLADAAEPGRVVPDLGSAVVMDQLRVMVFDLFTADPATDADQVASALADLRRTL